MTTYKLIYFNLKAVAEPLRLILAYAKVPYEDVRIDPATWINVKTDHKWQYLPELHIMREDKKGSPPLLISQSRAIGRYLAKEHDLMPMDKFLALRCDEIVDTLQDMRLKLELVIISKFFKKDGQWEHLKEKKMSQEFPLMLKNLNDLVSDLQREGSSGSFKGDFVLGKELSWADFWMASYLSQWEDVLDEPGLLDDKGRLRAQKEAVLALPQIKGWIQKRPNTLI